MPIPELMTWIAAQRRWTKSYRGKRYYVSCRQLGTAETKEDSIQAANQWWRDKQAEIDYAVRAAMRKPAPLEDVAAASMGVPADAFADLRRLLESALLREEEHRRGKGRPATAPEGDDEILIDDPPDPGELEEIRRREVMGLLERLLFGDKQTLPEDVAEQLPPTRAKQVERAVAELRGESPVDPARTVGAMVEAWLRRQQARINMPGGMTPARWDNVRHCVGHFAAFLDKGADVAVIDAEHLEGFHSFCLARIAERAGDGKAGWSTAYAREVFAVARMFVRWLWERGTIEAPPNLNSKSFSFGSTVVTIQTWTLDEVRWVIGEARGKLKLAMLLMLNIGATQRDVAELLDSEVNWREGRIVRKRSKTRGRTNAPVVNYKLWPATFALLREHRSGSERVLQTRSGEPYVKDRHVNGRLVASDQFARMFQELRDKIGFRKQLKQLRKTSASLLESHPVYGRFVGLFLGHAPATMKEKHYAAPPQDLFDEAVNWLGKQLGFVD